MPAGKEVVVIVGATCAGLITMLNALVAFPALLAALTVKFDVPAVVGVPDIAPVVPLRLKPAGRLPMVISQDIGVVPVAARVWL